MERVHGAVRCHHHPARNHLRGSFARSSRAVVSVVSVHLPGVVEVVPEPRAPFPYVGTMLTPHSPADVFLGDVDVFAVLDAGCGIARPR